MISPKRLIILRRIFDVHANIIDASVSHSAIRFTHQTLSNSNTENEKRFSKLKSYDQIPTKSSLLPASIELLLSGGADYLHEHCDKRHEELGPIYRDYLGNIEIVFLSDTKHIETVVNNEGTFPRHNVPEAWSFYNELHNIERGLFFQMGEPWARLRKVFSKVMLADPARFGADLLKINEDLLDNWQVKFNVQSGNNINSSIVPDVKAALCNWSIESTGAMLFGCRMGCVPVGRRESEVDGRANELVRHVTNMFTETSNFQMIPVQLAYKLKLGSWKRFEEATNGMLRIGNLYAAENLLKVRENSTSGGSLLADIMKMNALSQDEISRSLVDLLIAAADTTSAALQWMLYLLAKHHEDLQPRLFSEISGALKEFTTMDNFSKGVPLLRAFIRESLRLYPTAPFLARTLDRDIVLDGYEIPAGKLLVFSLYTTSRMEKYFDEPLKFKPERWLRHDHNAEKVESPPTDSCPHHHNRSRHAYASLPFGTGVRKCIGHRAAECQMMLFLASFVSKFQSRLSCGHQDDTQVRLKMILAPTKPISIILRPR